MTTPREAGPTWDPPEILPAHHTNWIALDVVRGEQRISILPRATPVSRIVGTGIIIALGGGGITFGASKAVPAFVPFILAFVAATVILTVLLIYFCYRREQKLGPVLHIELPERRFVLPRLGREFALEEIAGFCLVNRFECVQIQLQTRTAGRFLLIPSISQFEMKKMLKELMAAAPLDAWVYTGDDKAPGGWRVDPFDAYRDLTKGQLFRKSS